eukprot:CAMPEP_0115843968 /NCGR_PEP_ID=MMETSP0287-20121206/8588_1 /TAXON_ID=412157 /ORGANISM="Chrysochromulina rotalis, Strain UIO044" /LENGTH=115 /DNA_ID=CAMNT_0003297683 /DNA_START=105 /DNA_END=452 /DNA_ORIENTATION=+
MEMHIQSTPPSHVPRLHSTGTGGKQSLASARVAAWRMQACTSGDWPSANFATPLPVMPWKKSVPPATNTRTVANATTLKPPPSNVKGLGLAKASASAASLAVVCAFCNSSTVLAG